MEMKLNNALPVEALPGRVHCYLCTHNVAAIVLTRGSARQTKPGQSCPRCKASLDSSYALEVFSELTAA
jgi:hypothetical protein